MSRSTAIRLLCWALIAAWIVIPAVVVAVKYSDLILRELNWRRIPELAPILMVVVFCLVRRRRVRPGLGHRLDQHSRHGRLYLEGFAVFAAAQLLLMLPLELGSTVRMLGGPASVALAVIYVLIRARRVHEVFAEVGVHRGSGVTKEILVGLLIGCALATMHLWRIGVPTPLAGGGLAGEPWGRLLSVAVFAPIFEEPLFRGFLYRHLRDRWRWPVAAVISAGVFAVMHPAIFAWPGLFAGGLVLTVLREWRGSLIAPIVAHGVDNALLLVMVHVAFGTPA